MAYLRAARHGVVLCVRVQPRSSRNEVVGMVGDSLKLRVNTPPVGGAANEACRGFLAKLFGISKGRVEIISGSKSREKRILLRGIDKESVSARISELVQKSQ
ncbi:MAG: YggU family protein [Candidatus Hydrogenedentota bacterium]|nr:MAG: YggU family protein [Candidatus Hydrogenedentota bacterium]